MSRETKRTSDAWSDEYANLLAACTGQPEADLLRRAARLGRALVARGIPSHQLARTHATCLERLRARTGGDGRSETAAGALILSEALRAYDGAAEHQHDVNRNLQQRMRRLRRVARELRQSRSTLRQNETDFRALADNANDAILVGTRDGRYVYANQRAASVTGYTTQELIDGVTMETLIAPHELSEARRRLRARFAGDSPPEQYEIALVRKTGEQVPIDVTSARTVWQGEPAVLGFFRDDSDRKRTERLLRQSEEKYRSLVANIPVVTWTADSAGRTEYISANIEAIYGFTAEEMLDAGGELYFPRIHPEDVARVRAAYEALFTDGVMFDVEYRIRRKDGKWTWFHERALRTYEKEGRRYADGVVSDVTRRKRAEEDLRQTRTELEGRVSERTADLEATNRRLRAEVAERTRIEDSLRRREAILAALGFAADRFLTEPDWRMCVNEVLARLGDAGDMSRVYVFENHTAADGTLLTSQRYEWTAAGVESQFGNRDRHGLPWRAAGFSRWEDALSAGHTVSGHVREFPDRERQVLAGQKVESILAVPVFVDRQWWGFMGFDECRAQREWTKVEVETLKAAAATLGSAIRRQHAEEALRHSEHRFRAMVEAIPVAVAITRIHDGKILYANTLLDETLGVARERAVGRRILDFYFDPSKRQKLLDDVERQGQLRDYEVRVKRADGTPFWGALSTQPMIFDGEPALINGLKDVSERKQAAELLKLQRDLGIALSAADNLEESLDRLLEVATRVEGADAGAVFLFDEATGGLEMVAHRGVPAASLEVMKYFPADSFHARLVAEGKPAYWPGSAPTPSGDDCRRAGLRGRSVIPVLDRGRVIASLNMASLTLEEIPAPSRTVLEAIAARAGGVIARMRAVEALREREELFRTVVSASKDAIVAVNHEGLITIFNPAAETMFGHKREEMIGQSLAPLLPKKYRRLHPRYVREYLAAGPRRDAMDRTLEVHAVRRDGRSFPVELSLSMGHPGGRPLILAVIRDVTDRKRADDELRKFKTISDRASYGATIADLEGHIIYTNDSFAEMHGYAPTELVGQHLSVFHTEEQMPGVNALNASLRENGSFRAEEVWHVHRDGSVFPTLMNAVVITDDDGTPLFLSATAIDITERKRDAEALRKQSEILENVLTHIPHSVFWKDKQSVYLGCNQNFAREAGLETPGEIVGKTDYDLPWSREQTEFYTACDREVIGANRPLLNIEEGQLRADGTEAALLTSKTPLRDAEGRVIGVLGIYADITERRRIEETLRRQALVFDNMHDGVIVTDAEARITEWNPGAARMFGYPRHETLGRTAEFLYPAETAPDQDIHIRDAARREGQWTGEIRFAHKDGRVGLCEATIVALRDDRGAFVGTVGVATDITERRRAEEEARRRQEELAHVSRLATMGEMATGLAHELNQPLSAILYYARGNARRMRTGRWDSDRVLEVMEKVAAQAERAGAFIDRFRAFVRKGTPRFSAVDLNRAVREAAGFAEHDVHARGVQLDFQLALPLRPVHADIIQVEQVILNVLRNGIEAMQDCEPAKRRVTIQTSNAGSEAVVCAVSDSGCGISAEAAGRLFDAFFTTKPQGLGMGLAVSRSIIEAHGGRLWATPNPGGGTTFRFTLPVAQSGVTL